jgi:hypothetical protein
MKKLFVLACVLAFSASALGQSVAILGSPNTPEWNDDVAAKLLGTGKFTTVDIYNIADVTPTVAELKPYGSVLVYSDGVGFENAVQLGNNLADYVDGGGGVVTAVFTNASIPFEGRFADENYWAIEPENQSGGSHLMLGDVLVPDSPLMTGVSTFDGGDSSYFGTGIVNVNATLIAEWDNNAPLVALRDDIPVSALNFFPPSSDARSDFWVAGTNGDILMANALLYTPEPSTALLLLGMAGFALRRR